MPPAAHIPLFLYPFLNTVSKTRPFEYLRLTSLGVIGALVKVWLYTSGRPAQRYACGPDSLRLRLRHQVDDTDVINFLLSTEIIPLCLRTMEMGSELSKTVATFIVQKILLDDVRVHGLAIQSRAEPLTHSIHLLCNTRWASPTSAPPRRGATPWAPCWEAWSRCWCVHTTTTCVISPLVLTLCPLPPPSPRLPSLQQEQPSVRLLKHIIRCYLRLSENARARECLRQCFPDQLRDPSFVACLKDDQTTRRWLQQLLVQMGQSEVGQ